MIQTWLLRSFRQMKSGIMPGERQTAGIDNQYVVVYPVRADHRVIGPVEGG